LPTDKKKRSKNKESKYKQSEVSKNKVSELDEKKVFRNEVTELDKTMDKERKSEA